MSLSSKNKNLLAAKQALGLADSSVSSSADGSSRTGSGYSNAATSSAGPSVIRGRFTEQKGDSSARSGYSNSTGPAALSSAGARGGLSAASSYSPASRKNSNSKHSYIHNLSARARQDARYSESDDNILNRDHDLLGINSSARSAAKSTQSAASSRKSPSHLKSVSQSQSASKIQSAINAASNWESMQSITVDELIHLEEGSQEDSMLDSSKMNNNNSKTGNLGMSSSFNNVYEKKISFTDDDGGTSAIAEGRDEGGTIFSESSDTFMDSSVALVPIAETEIVKYDDDDDDDHHQQQHDDYQIEEYNESHATLTTDEDNFVPQRFDEMRSLLLGITPLQLEALMMEIFGDDTPIGWKGIGNGGNSGKNRKKKPLFRKNAYLTEMNLEELQCFSQGMNLAGIENCETHDEAMDLIAIEFERLVSVHQNRPEDGDHAEIEQQHTTIEDDVMSYISNGTNNNIEDEGENLRRSLRACSIPELRLVAERLQLDHASYVAKMDLIILIENSMPAISGSNALGASSHDGSNDESADDYYKFQHQEQYQQQLQESDQEQEDTYSRNRKVSFARDCKEDLSHLVEKHPGWHSFVTDGDVEHGEESESHQLVDGNNGDDDWIKNERSSRRREWVFKRKRLIFGFLILCVVGLSVGLGVGLTKDSDGSGASGSNLLIPEGGLFGGAFQPTQKPTLIIVNETEASVAEGGIPIAVVIEQEPTSLSPTSKNPTFKPTNLVMTTNKPSSSPVTPAPAVTEVAITPSPTTYSALKITPTPTNIVTQTNKPTTGAMNLVEPTDQPSPLSPYPLLGPYDEVGMRIILYGISKLSNMGRTQWHMLTAAYVEQFFNVEGQGDDAIQNIVFDVVCKVEITDEEQMATGAGGSDGRALQDTSLILTYNMQLSYRTFSSFLTVDTVAERPFFDEQMRSEYIQFLIDNNAVQFVGDILGVSEIFRGNEIPENPTWMEEDTAISTNAVPTGRPSIEWLDNDETLNPTWADDPTYHPTDTPIKNLAAETLLPTKNPTREPITKPTRKPTEYPTQNSFDIAAPYPTDSLTLPKQSAAPTQNALFPPLLSFPPTENRMFILPESTPGPTVSLSPSSPGSSLGKTPNPTSINTAAHVYMDTLTNEPTGTPTGKPTMPPRMSRTRPPTNKPTTLSPTSKPTSYPTNRPTTQSPTSNPTSSPTDEPTLNCDLISDPICPFLTQIECCQPMCKWNSFAGSCLFINESSDHEVEWMGELEVGQTHVVKAKGETRHAPRLIAHREAEFLFTPDDVRRLSSSKSPIVKRSLSLAVQRIESVGRIYLSREFGEIPGNLEELAQLLLNGGETLFPVPNYIPDLDIIIDTMSLRLISDISIVLDGDTSFSNVQFGLRFDDGCNQEEKDIFQLPKSGWLWHDIESHNEFFKSTISTKFPKRQARYIIIRLKGGSSKSSHAWGLRGVEVSGYLDGLLETNSPSSENKVLSMTRAFPQTNARARFYTPSNSDYVRVAVYTRDGRLLGVINPRDPANQRDILERKLSKTSIDPYSDSAWSATIPHNWVDEGNVVLIGCINKRRPLELLIHRLELKNLAQFSEHTITRTKLAIFGDEEDLARLVTTTFEAKRLVRDLFSAMPVGELKWADTDVWHLPYMIVMGPQGPALVNSEEERRSVTGEGEEISWKVLKNYLTIRHSLAQSGLGFVETSESGSNSPFASGTSVFMGWSLSKQVENSWEWEDLGYWDTLAAAAWTGWCAMRAGDECSNYFIHEIGHAQSMQHFDKGTALNWGIAAEYPNDGVYLPTLPWGYDSVSRRFRTWFDPFDGSGKLDPLFGEGEGPTSESCFTQYTPYQAQKSQEWAMSTPILLSAASSDVPSDGAYKFNPQQRQYVLLEGTSFSDEVGNAVMKPNRVGIPVVTLIGTIGREREVCQTYPALRSRSGNTFEFPDPFRVGLPSVFDGAAHFVTVRFEDGSSKRGLVAAKMDWSAQKALLFYSFNVEIEQRPIAVDLYRFIDSSYPNVTPESKTQLLHIRPIEFPLDDPLDGLPPLLRVGRGWLGDSPEIVIDRFCVSNDDCFSDAHTIEWRSDVGSDNVLYTSNLTPSDNNVAAAASIFKVPVLRQGDSKEFTVNVLATRYFNNRIGSSPMLSTSPLSSDGSSDPDATHGIRIIAPWDMNKRLPSGIYRTSPGTLRIQAKDLESDRHLLEFNVSLNFSTVTASPTSAPTKHELGPTHSPIEVRYHIDWKYGTCVNDGNDSNWSPPYPSKSECCSSHMAYEYDLCMSKEPWHAV